MNNSMPKHIFILNYINFFNHKPPEERLSLVKKISKKDILYEITALNYRLKPKDVLRVDESNETQLKELRYFTHTTQRYNEYFKIFDTYTKEYSNHPIIFNRETCLFILEEIVNNMTETEYESDVKNYKYYREIILKYILAVNYEINIIEEEMSNNISFEDLNPKLLPLHELQIATNPIQTAYRGYNLINFFIDESDFSFEVKQYFQETYKIEPGNFIFQIMSMYMNNNNKNPDLNFYYQIREEQKIFFDQMSVRRNLNDDTYKFINIRKSPFIKVDNEKYLLTDNTFLIEKTYNQLINDLWFDKIKHIKEKSEEELIKHYRGVIGRFFEKYLSDMLHNCFDDYKHSVLLAFGQLKIRNKGKELELADVYFRNGTKVIIGEVKSGSIYDKEKYGGDVESLYKNNRNKFFDDFGVNQVLDHIEKVDEFIIEVDPKFRKGHAYTVYPCIIFNDKAFQTPFMAQVFNNRFQELLKNYEFKKTKIKPLTMIHISDFESMESYLKKEPKLIWEYLNFNFRNKNFIPPFYNTLNNKFDLIKTPERVFKLFEKLILRYNPQS